MSQLRHSYPEFRELNAEVLDVVAAGVVRERTIPHAKVAELRVRVRSLKSK